MPRRPSAGACVRRAPSRFDGPSLFKEGAHGLMSHLSSPPPRAEPYHRAQCDSRDACGRWSRRGSRGRRRCRPAGRCRRRASPSRGRCREPGHRGRRRGAGGEFLGGTSTSMRRAATSRMIDVAGADQAERPAGRGLGRDVQDDRAVRGAAHPAVADAHHVADALLEQLLRQRQVRHLGHARVALAARSRAGPAPSRRRRPAPGRRCGRGSPRCESNTTARPRCCSRCGEAAAGLMIAPSGARLPRSTAMPASAQRLGARRGSPRGPRSRASSR